MLRFRFIASVLFAALFSSIMSAQGAPVPAVVEPSGADLSGSYMMAVKDQSFRTGWQGADFSATKYLMSQWGFRAEADLERMDNAYKFREYGVRGGAVRRFGSALKMHPYAEFLVGYARDKASFFPGPYDYHSGLSLMGGGGVDYRIKHGWYVRGGLDMVADKGDASAYGSKFGRATLGIVRRIGDER